MNGDQITPPGLGCQAPGRVLYLLPERWGKKDPVYCIGVRKAVT
jgi:hypothetical protein